jgi:acetolactate synthase-1/2/3 large subunit
LDNGSGTDEAVLGSTVRAVAGQVAAWRMVLTGAEAIAVLLADAGVTDVFAYARTSEFALCDAVDHATGIRVINGRDDRESILRCPSRRRPNSDPPCRIGSL